MHEAGEIAFRGLQDQVEMVAHRTEQVEPDSGLGDALFQAPQEPLEISLVPEEPLPAVAPTAQHAAGDVVDGPGEFDAQRTRHGMGSSLERASEFVNL